MSSSWWVSQNFSQNFIELIEHTDEIGEAGINGVRRYDAHIRVGDVLYQIEMKSWDPKYFSDYMRTSLNGLKKTAANADELNDVVPGQMSKDLIDGLRQIGFDFNGSSFDIDTDLLDDAMSKRWVFDSRMSEKFGSPEKIADEVVNIFKSDQALTKQLIVKSSKTPIAVKDISEEMLEIFTSEQLPSILVKIFSGNG